MTPGAAGSAAACAAAGYTYAGYASGAPVQAVSAVVAARSGPLVASGHVAAWVGVGGLHAGPNRSNEWLQVGLAAYRVGDSPGNVITPLMPYFPLIVIFYAAQRHLVGGISLSGMKAQ